MIDEARRAAAKPSDDGRLYREVSTDDHTLITYSTIADADVDRVVAAEVSRLRELKATLEWDVYSHDPQKRLLESLRAAGFAVGPKERVLAVPATPQTIQRFEAPNYDIRRIHDLEGLEHMARISREIGRKNVDEETRRLAELRDAASTMNLYIAYVDDEPVACGRLHFAAGGVPFAWLCGGRTKTTHRNRGLYTALVRKRIEDAIDRNCRALVVDALPSSEPILSKRGFHAISDKQAFVLEP